MPKTVSFARWALDPYGIGLKLRGLRTQKSLTLSRLAAETGLSTALLSKLETDRMIPTLPTLAAICRVYGVSIGYFFADATHHTLSITRKEHLQGTARIAEGMKVVHLNGRSAAARLRAQMIECPPGGAPATWEGAQRSGFLYVLEGRLQLNAGGTIETLEPGDCAYMESDMEISWSAAGKHRCRVLVVLPAGERASANFEENAAGLI